MSDGNNVPAVIDPAMTVTIDTHSGHVADAMVSRIESELLGAETKLRSDKAALETEIANTESEINKILQTAAEDAAEQPTTIIDGLALMGYNNPRFSVASHRSSNGLVATVSVLYNEGEKTPTLFTRSSVHDMPAEVDALDEKLESLRSEKKSLGDTLAEIGRSLQNMDRITRAAKGAIAENALSNAGDAGQALLDQMGKFMPASVSHLLPASTD